MKILHKYMMIIYVDWCQSLENILLKNDTINLFDFGKNSDKRWVHNHSTTLLLFENEKQKDKLTHIINIRRKRF